MLITSFEMDAKRSGMQEGIELGMQQGIAQGVKQGMQQGIQQGVKQGMQQGMQQEKKTTALSLKKMGMELDKIATVTGLSKEEIKNL